MTNHRTDYGLHRIVVPMLIGMLGLSEVMAQPHSDDPPYRDRVREGRADHESERPHMDRWLAQLRDADPEEYERVIALRESDPEAFRMEMRERVQAARRLHRLRASHPDLHERLADLPPEERERIGEALRGPLRDGPSPVSRHRRWSPPGMEPDGASRSLLDAWHRADGAEEKAAARAALIAHLEEVFDQRTEEQKERIQRAEEQIEELRRILDARRDNREVWIDRLIERLLSEHDRPGQEDDRGTGRR